VLVVFLLWINGYFNKSGKDFVLRECYKNVSELVVFFIFTIPQLNIKHFNMNKMNCTRKRTKGGAVKFLSIAILLLMSIGNAFGQVATTYTFSESVGTYTPITGGTQLVTTTAGATAYDTDASGFSLPAGSQFTFNGTLITSVTMVADGALVLGTSTASTSTAPISSTMTATGIILES